MHGNPFQLSAEMVNHDLKITVAGDPADMLVAFAVLANALTDSLHFPKELLMGAVAASDKVPNAIKVAATKIDFSPYGSKVMEILKKHPEMSMDEALKAAMKGGASCG